MYVLKNAWLNIIRNKGRNILIGIIFLVISFAATITLAIKNTSDSLIESYYDSYQVEATIGFSRSNMKDKFDFTNSNGMGEMKEAFSNINSLTEDDVINYADSDYVKDYHYTYSVNLNSDDIEKVSSDFSFENNTDNKKMNRPTGDINSYDFSLVGYNSIESMNDFINGNYSISEIEDDAWNLIFDGSYCMINKELADLNEINLLDEITFIDSDSKEVISLIVVGIYEENTDDADMSNISMFSSSANSIIANTAVISSINDSNSDLKFSVTPTFILDSYEDADDFEEELYEKGMSEYYSVSTNESEIESATSGISNVSSFVTTFLILTLIIGVVVLLVVNQINIRERKYEIGVLRTIGMKKITLTFQFVCELLIVSIFSLMLGAGFGACVSKPIGNTLLQNEIENTKNSVNEISENFGRGPNGQGVGNKDFSEIKVNGMISVQAYDSIDAVVDFKVILELLGIGILLTLIGSVSSIMSIQKFSPLTILKERS